MNYNNLNIADAPHLYALDQIIKPHLEALTDASGVNRIFDTVKYGIGFPTRTPDGAQPLSCFIWVNRDQPVMQSTPCFVREVKTNASLFINIFDHTKGRMNVSFAQSNICRWILKSFEGADNSSDQPSGLPMYTGLEFDYDSFDVHHNQAFKKINEMLIVEPPWYTSRIDFSYTCDNNKLPVLFT